MPVPLELQVDGVQVPMFTKSQSAFEEHETAIAPVQRKSDWLQLPASLPLQSALTSQRAALLPVASEHFPCCAEQSDSALQATVGSALHVRHGQLSAGARAPQETSAVNELTPVPCSRVRESPNPEMFLPGSGRQSRL